MGYLNKKIFYYYYGPLSKKNLCDESLFKHHISTSPIYFLGYCPVVPLLKFLALTIGVYSFAWKPYTTLQIVVFVQAVFYHVDTNLLKIADISAHCIFRGNAEEIEVPFISAIFTIF